MTAGSRIRRGVVLWVMALCFAPCVANGQGPQRDPQLDLVVMMVRNALTAANHGNLTGNYTVLRDLGGPAFREQNSAAQLAVLFQQLREQKTDLSPTLVQDPVFTEAPALDQAGNLQLVGFFPTQPLRVNFRVAFQRVQGGWMIDTIAVGTTPAQTPPQTAAAAGYAPPPQMAAPPGYPPAPTAPANVARRPTGGNY
jgi:hypothetical protein